ncbi:TcaA NTF2-like domain-containing protein [Halalkalibacter alkaliphilus]|uniref:TcaA protein NTF2-like domain-containing protein n=1 Tax=Halalkalibacter alkaliphilus TaxID=2917993 RepID=A0A9X2I4F2_9BACI|nr:hypothetical protein [Halalkalibacter alkaliphilus]MCL7748026.1 hypothetical protein [Halalkalibacter alkaliphilus]
MYKQWIMIVIAAFILGACSPMQTVKEAILGPEPKEATTDGSLLDAEPDEGNEVDEETERQSSSDSSEIDGNGEAETESISSSGSYIDASVFANQESNTSGASGSNGGTREETGSRPASEDAGANVDVIAQEEELKDKIYRAVERYEYGLIEAINSGNFQRVAPAITPNSPLYHDQIGLVERLYERGITEKLHQFTIQHYELNSHANEHRVVVDVTVEIIQKDQSSVINDYTWTYTIEERHGEMTLSNLE